MPARSVCLVTLSLSEAGPGRFGRQASVTDIYHTMPSHHAIPYHAILAIRCTAHIPTLACAHACAHVNDQGIHMCVTRPYRIDVTRRLGYNCFPAVILTTGMRMKGGYGMVWYGMVDVYDGYLAAEASRSSFG